MSEEIEGFWWRIAFYLVIKDNLLSELPPASTLRASDGVDWIVICGMEGDYSGTLSSRASLNFCNLEMRSVVISSLSPPESKYPASLR